MAIYRTIPERICKSLLKHGVSSRSDIARNVNRTKKHERILALKSLVDAGHIEMIVIKTRKPGVNEVLYQITEKGDNWINSVL